MYPSRCIRYNMLHSMSVTAGYSGELNLQKGINRATEKAAIKELAPREQQEMEAVCKALERIHGTMDGMQKIKLIDLFYFKRSHTLYGAAMKTACSERTAKRWNTEFLTYVGIELGYLKVGTPEPKKCDKTVI